MTKPIFATFLMLVPTLAWAESGAAVRAIEVTAEATKRVVPDTVLWNLTINAKHKDLVRAKKESDRQMKDILATVRRLGVKPTDVQTGQLTVGKEYEGHPHRGETRRFKHFTLMRQIRIKQRGTKRFDAFLTGLIKNRDMTVSYQLASSKLATIQAKTRVKAMIAVREKARAMAAAIGATLGPVLSIKEHAGGYLSLNRREMQNNLNLGAGEDVQGTFAPGAIPVSVTVGASFQLK